MRSLMAKVALAILVVASAEAQDRGKDAPSDAVIIDTCGGRLAKIFTQFGAPQDVSAKRENTASEDEVLLDYGAFGFLVHDKMVGTCFFWSDWKGPIRGVKMGDSREDVVKVMGNTRAVYKDKNGVVTDYEFVLKDLGLHFYTKFDNDGKVKRVEINVN